MKHLEIKAFHRKELGSDGLKKDVTSSQIIFAYPKNMILTIINPGVQSHI